MKKKTRRSGLLCLFAVLMLAGCGKSGATGTSGISEQGITAETGTQEKSSEDKKTPDDNTAEDMTANSSSNTEETGTEIKTEKATVAEQEVLSPGMIPVSADQLRDGTYEIQVKSSSSMFDITSCYLTVSEGTMTAKMIMGGKGYLYVYPGTTQEAEKAPEADRIPFQEEADGSHSFTFPVKALNEAVPCAAFSKKKELWYDRNLCFEAAALPLEAYLEKPYKDAKDLGIADGTYQVPVTLQGGSGKASVASPAKLVIENGEAVAEIIWSSPNYDYMVVDGTKYLPVNETSTENSVFNIPVAGFDYPLPVKADTTAMSQAHEIEYTLTFESAGIQ